MNRVELVSVLESRIQYHKREQQTRMLILAELESIISLIKNLEPDNYLEGILTINGREWKYVTLFEEDEDDD